MARTRVWKKEWLVVSSNGVICKESSVNRSGSSSGSVCYSLVDGQPQQFSQNNRRLSLASHLSTTQPKFVSSTPRGGENVDPNLGSQQDKSFVDKGKVFSEQELKHFLVLLLEWCLHITKATENLRNVRSFSVCELVSLHFGNGEILVEVLKSGGYRMYIVPIGRPRYLLLPAGVVNLSWAWSVIVSATFSCRTTRRRNL